MIHSYEVMQLLRMADRGSNMAYRMTRFSRVRMFNDALKHPVVFSCDKIRHFNQIHLGPRAGLA